MNKESAIKFRKKALSPFFRLFLLRRLPLAFFAGVRLRELNDSGSKTTLKFRWINQNPFRSMYFAAMHMAAEFATGALLFQYLDSSFRFSMLLVETKADFYKKAVGKISFSCQQAEEVSTFLNELNSKLEGDTIVLRVLATNEDKETVAELRYTWSCKIKK